MGVDGESDVLGFRSHLQRQHGLDDQLAGAQANDPGAHQSPAGGLEQQFGETIVASQGKRPPRCRPGKNSRLELQPLLAGIAFGEAHPRHLGVGVGHRGDRAGVELRALARYHFGRHLALVRCLVGKHRAADDVTDGLDPRHVGA